MATLLERVDAAIHSVREQGSQLWDSGPVAVRWIEHELAPLIDAYKLAAEKEWTPCPLCSSGVSWAARSTTFSCGHRVSIRDLDDVEAPLGRVVLPLGSGQDSIRPGHTAQITSRPHRSSFRPQRLIIGGDAAAWRVVDIRIGNRSQIGQAGEIDGAMFGREARDPIIRFETCQTAMDVVLTVRYEGSIAKGEVFLATLIGVADETDQQARLARWSQITGAENTQGAGYIARERFANRRRLDNGTNGCLICNAEPTLWCDAVVHDQIEAFILSRGDQPARTT